MDDDPTRRCDTCVFWCPDLEDEPGAGGDCRRFPPRAEGQRWPRSDQTDWCGEHKPWRYDGPKQDTVTFHPTQKGLP